MLVRMEDGGAGDGDWYAESYVVDDDGVCWSLI